MRYQLKDIIVFFLIVIFVSMMLYAFYVSDDESTERSFKIGVILPLTGEKAVYGLAIKNGIDLAAIDETFYDIQIVYENSECNKDKAVEAVNKLINVDKVDAIIGDACSESTIEAAKVAQENGIVLVSPSAISSEMSGLGDYIFKMALDDELQGEFAANFIYQKGYRRLAIIYIDDNYGNGLSNYVGNNYANLSGEIIALESFDSNDRDFISQLVKIKNLNADSLLIISNSPGSSIEILRQAMNLGINIKIFGSDKMMLNEVSEISAAKNIIVISVKESSDGFSKRYNEVFNKDPELYSSQGYDSLVAITKAIRNSGSLSKTEIKDKMHGVEFEGASGHIIFDENGDIIGNYAAYEVRDKKFVLID